jgi:hypothetical protein
MHGPACIFWANLTPFSRKGFHALSESTVEASLSRSSYSRVLHARNDHSHNDLHRIPGAQAGAATTDHSLRGHTNPHALRPGRKVRAATTATRQ